MPNKNKNKGKAFENQVCKILIDIFGGSFIRCFASGAYVGGINYQRMSKLSESQIQNNRGDIVPDDSMKNLIIECKSYKEFPFHNLLVNKNIPILDSWLDQVELDVLNNEFYFIAFKINNKGIFGVFKYDLVSNYNLNINQSIYYKDNNKYIITDLINFLKLNKELIREKCKNGLL